MDALVVAIEASPFAAALRVSRWAYPAVNTLHLLGVVLLVGAVVPMDLRLAGLWRPGQRLHDVLALLQPVAAFGALLAVVSGFMLFAVQARDYVDTPLFWAKLALVLIGLVHALAWGGRLGQAPAARQRVAGLVSLAVWLPALACGRLLGYV